MTRYIDKDSLAAEIERRIKEIDEIGTYLSPKGVLTNLLCHLNALEVKEVNEVPATVMVNKYGNRFISSWSGLKEYDGFKEGEEIKIAIPKK